MRSKKCVEKKVIFIIRKALTIFRYLAHMETGTGLPAKRNIESKIEKTYHSLFF